MWEETLREGEVPEMLPEEQGMNWTVDGKCPKSIYDDGSHCWLSMTTDKVDLRTDSEEGEVTIYQYIRICSLCGKRESR